MDFEKPRAARTTNPGARSPIARTLWTALAVALTAILLPAAISLASTGSLSTYSVVGAITGAKPKPEKAEKSSTASPERRESTRMSDDDDEDEKVAVLSDTSDAIASSSDSDKRRGKDDENRKSDDADDRRRGGDDEDRPRAHRPDDSGKHSSDEDDSDDSPKGADDTETPAEPAPVAEAEDKPRVEEPTPRRTPVVTPTRRPVTVTPVATPDAPADEAAGGTDDTSVPVPADEPTTDVDEPTDARRRFVLASGESVTLVVDVPETGDVLTLWARGAVSGCAPQVAVLVDRELYGLIDLAGTDWHEHAVEPAPDAGIHTVRLVAIGTDTEDTCTGDPDEDRITLVEPKAGDEGKMPPSGETDETVAPTDETTSTDAPVDGSTDSPVDGSTDSPVDGSTDAPVDGSTDAPVDGSTESTDAPVDSTGTSTDSTTDASGNSTDSPDAPADETSTDTTDTSVDGNTTDTTSSDEPTTDEPTTDAGSTDGAVDPTAAAVDMRRQFVLRRGESVSLTVSATEEDTLTLWARASRNECAPDVAVSVNRRHVDYIEVTGDGWQQHVLEEVRDGDVHNVRLAFADINGDDSCATETVTLVEPMTGDIGAAEPVTIEPDVDTGTGTGTGADPGTDTGTDTGTGAPTEGAPTGNTKATLLWKGDFESALNGFGNAPWNYAGAPTPSTMSVGSGEVGKFEVPSGVGRSELVGTGPASALSNGQVRYFAWSTYLPADFAFSPKWRILAQWKNAGTGSPPLEMKLINDQWHLDGGWHNGSCAEGSDHRTAWTGTAARGRWTNFVAGIKFQEGTSTNPYAGWVELWQDGKQVLPRTAWKTLYRGCNSYLKLGLYRDPSIGTHDVVYHDNWKMGTTYTSVAQ